MQFYAKGRRTPLSFIRYLLISSIAIRILSLKAYFIFMWYNNDSSYTSYAFRSHLEDLKCRQSFSVPGYLYDNSACESFFNALKNRRFIITFTNSAAELAAVLDEYIEYYNEVRMHRTWKTKTPSQVETEFFEHIVL